MLQTLGSAVFASVVGTMVVLGALTLLELALPRGGYPLKTRALGAVYWLITIVCIQLIALTLRPMWRSLDVEPLVTLEIGRWYGWAGPLAGLLIALTVLIVTDFFGYWFHRLQHGPLWRFHALHHSIEEMHAVNSYGFAADSVFAFFLVVIPMSLVPFGAYDAPIYLTVFLLYQEAFLHSPTRVHYGPVGWLLSDNRYHRIHHSVEPRHFQKNYGTITTIWDRVFGTAYFPAKDEWPDTGLAEMPQPRSLREYLDFPLRFRRPATAEA